MSDSSSSSARRRLVGPVRRSSPPFDGRLETDRHPVGLLWRRGRRDVAGNERLQIGFVLRYVERPGPGAVAVLVAPSREARSVWERDAGSDSLQRLRISVARTTRHVRIRSASSRGSSNRRTSIRAREVMHRRGRRRIIRDESTTARFAQGGGSYAARGRLRAPSRVSNRRRSPSRVRTVRPSVSPSGRCQRAASLSTTDVVSPSERPSSHPPESSVVAAESRSPSTAPSEVGTRIASIPGWLALPTRAPTSGSGG